MDLIVSHVNLRLDVCVNLMLLQYAPEVSHSDKQVQS